MERQTDYTLDQIREMLKGATPFAGCHAPGALCSALPSGEPSGFILNEVGLIFLEGGEESKEAEADLMAMLTGDNERTQSLAYFYFMYAGRAALSAEALRQLETFEADSKNIGAITLAKSQLNRFLQ